MQFLQITRLDGENDAVVTPAHLEQPLLVVCQVNRIVLPGMKENVLDMLRVIINVPVPVGNVRDVLDDDDRLGVLGELDS